jgi:two-component system sensor histidine kinase VicK
MKNAIIARRLMCSKEKAAEKATHDFTVHLSHELLTPLTTIKSYSEMLMDGEISDSETQKEFYNTINSETDRLTHLIRTLLNVSKIEMGNLTLNKGLVKSDWLFEDSVAAVEGAALKKNISIQRNLPDHFPPLVGDKDQLKASLINILGNAVKYTPENGNIQFSVREQKDNVVFDVIDTGHGISPEDLPNIFDKFYRSKNPQISEEQGTGLGLAFTSEIVRLPDGDIEVVSELGKGTRFTVKIPKEEYRLESQ